MDKRFFTLALAILGAWVVIQLASPSGAPVKTGIDHVRDQPSGFTKRDESGRQGL